MREMRNMSRDSEKAAATIVRRRFTWGEWIERNTTVPPDGWQGSNDDSWAGGSQETALRMASTDGYQDAVPEAQALATSLYDTISALVNLDTFGSMHDVTGSEVDISRYMSGEPECMLEAIPIKVAGHGRAIRIVVSFSYRCGINEATVRRRGAAVMALVYVLQQLQHPMEVLASMAVKGFSWGGGGSSERMSYVVEVQRADEPVDIGRVMYALAHPTMLRRMAFRVEDHENRQIRQTFGIPGGRGSPDDTVASDLDEQGGTTIILPTLRSNDGWSVEESVAWIEEQLRLIFKED
jgi:hypothetical protein